jgi:GxxExxY protein
LSYTCKSDNRHTLFVDCDNSIEGMSLPLRTDDLPAISREGGQRLSMFQLTDRIIGSAIKIHRRLGPGLLESAYESCLAYELDSQGLRVVRQKAVPLVYERVKLECGFRADLVVENRVVVELKCKEQIHPIDEVQLLSHLRLLDLQVGLLMNFHVVRLRDGIRRIVNNYRDQADLPDEP